MNDFGNQGRLFEQTSHEAMKAQNATPTGEERRHRTYGWWPGGGTALKAIGLAVLVVLAIAWALTLLN